MQTLGKIVIFVVVSLIGLRHASSPSAVEPRQPITIIVPDEYQSIHAAMKAAVNGDTIFIKTGIYLEDEITLKDGVKLVGEGMDRVTVRSDIRRNRNVCVILADCKKGLIKGLTVEHLGTSTAKYRQVGIYLVDSSVEIVDCRVRKSVGNGLVVKNSKPTIRNCVFEYNNFGGIVVSNTESFPVIGECEIVNNKQHGIFFRQGAGGVVEKNTIEENLYDGVKVEEARRKVILKENLCRSNTGNGISIAESIQVEIEENVCEDNRMSGISVTKTEETSVLKHNTCKRNWRNGILIATGSKTEAESNICAGNSKNGICVSGKGASAVLKNNKCMANGESGIRFDNRASGAAYENICSENMANGIFLTDRHVRPLLKENQCIANKENGILFDNGANGTVESNICKNNQQHGIAILTNLSSPELKGNQLINNGGKEIFYTTAELAEARHLLQEEDFDQLEIMASEYREQKTRTKGGSWQLYFFYDYLSRNWSDPDTVLRILDKWIKEDPRSITPQILMAKVCTLHGHYAKAWDTLTKAEKLESNEPELYSSLIRAARRLGKPAVEIDIIFEKGRAIEPTYYPLYYEKAEYIQFNKSIPELINFMDKAVELTKEEEGYSFYARIASNVLQYYKYDDFKELGLSYEKMKQGFTNIINRFPNTSYYYSRYCLIASIYGDKETARELFEKIGNDWNRSAWRGENTFNMYKRWAYQEDSKPRTEKTVIPLHYLGIVGSVFLLVLVGLLIAGIAMKKMKVRQS